MRVNRTRRYGDGVAVVGSAVEMIFQGHERDGISKKMSSEPIRAEVGVKQKSRTL
jgi:hypothetical protein